MIGRRGKARQSATVFPRQTERQHETSERDDSPKKLFTLTEFSYLGLKADPIVERFI